MVPKFFMASSGRTLKIKLSLSYLRYFILIYEVFPVNGRLKCDFYAFLVKLFSDKEKNVSN